MDVNQTLSLLALGALLGTVGQGVRVVVGLKKEIDEAKRANVTVKDWFDAKELWISLLLGAIAGVFAVLASYGDDPLSKKYLVGLVAAGYAGADFIGGFMQKWLPGGTAGGGGGAGGAGGATAAGGGAVGAGLRKE